jgi:hypothetical protein
MARIVRGLLLGGLLLLVSGGVRAADEPAAGIYKVNILRPGGQTTLWLLKLDNKDGKWSGDTIAATVSDDPPKAAVANVGVKEGMLRLTFKLESAKFPFEGKLPADGKKIVGTLNAGQNWIPAHLELTGLKNLDLYDYTKEVFAQNTAGPDLIDAATVLLRQATDKKAKAEDVRAWASKAIKAAEAYGPRYQLHTVLRVADILAGQDDYVAQALPYARQAERLLTAGEKPGTQRRVLTLLAAILKKAGKEDEAKEVETKLGKIEMVALAKYPGRTKGDQVVLVELFTGADCGPCIAADMAFDALGKTYKPKEVILLQYHLHVPGPDPLSNADTEARQRYYDDEVDQTPIILFNGKLAAGKGGGSSEAAHDKYEDYMAAIDPLLDKESKVKLKTAAVNKGGKIEITANVSDIDKPSDNVRLRFALVEEEIKYQGGNKLPTHHHVVRALPGGANGFALKDKTSKQAVTVDLGELRKQLTTYLDDFSKKEEIKWKAKPLDLTKLRVIAFVQNDATKEVLQADEVEVKAAND